MKEKVNKREGKFVLSFLPFDKRITSVNEVIGIKCNVFLCSTYVIFTSKDFQGEQKNKDEKKIRNTK